MGAASVSGRGEATLTSAAALPRTNGVHMARHIISTEGVLGLYRGFGMSVATFVPSSGIWWGSYGAFQKLVWQQVCRIPTSHYNEVAYPAKICFLLHFACRAPTSIVW